MFYQESHAKTPFETIDLVQIKKWRSHLFQKKSWEEIAIFRRELQKKTYDIVFDFQGNCKSALVTALSRSPLKVGFGRKSVAEWPNLLITNQKYDPPFGGNIRDDSLFLVESILKKREKDNDQISFEFQAIEFNLSMSERKRVDLALSTAEKTLKVLVCPGAHWSNKMLSQHSLISFLKCFPPHLHAHFFLLWGSEKERKMAEEINKALPGDSSVIDRFSLPALHYFMSQVDLVVAMDSLPLHLAGLTSTPTFSIFGPSSAKKYRPIGKQHEALQGTCPYGKTFEKRCPLLRTCPTGACMKQLEGQELFDRFSSWWSSFHLN